MLYLSIDHGTTTGFTVGRLHDNKFTLLNKGFIHFSSESNYDDIYDAYEELFNIRYKGECVDTVIIEKVTFAGKNCGFGAVQRLFEIRTIIKLLAHQNAVNIIEVQPTHMKKVVTDRGKASKEEVAKILCCIFDLKYEECVPKHNTKNPRFDMLDSLGNMYAALKDKFGENIFI